MIKKQTIRQTDRQTDRLPVCLNGAAGAVPSAPVIIIECGLKPIGSHLLLFHTQTEKEDRQTSRQTDRQRDRQTVSRLVRELARLAASAIALLERVAGSAAA